MAPAVKVMVQGRLVWDHAVLKGRALRVHDLAVAASLGELIMVQMAMAMLVCHIERRIVVPCHVGLRRSVVGLRRGQWCRVLHLLPALVPSVSIHGNDSDRPADGAGGRLDYKTESLSVADATVELPVSVVSARPANNATLLGAASSRRTAATQSSYGATRQGHRLYSRRSLQQRGLARVDPSDGCKKRKQGALPDVDG